MENITKKARATDICCAPRMREQYDLQYNIGVDNRIRNFKGCGVTFIQKLPPICDLKYPLEDCYCTKNYYDEDCINAA